MTIEDGEDDEDEQPAMEDILEIWTEIMKKFMRPQSQIDQISNLFILKEKCRHFIRKSAKNKWNFVNKNSN